MKAFILAAGMGERLKPLTNKIPKPLLPVKGIPVIIYQLALLKSAGIIELVINIHHLGNAIREFFEVHDNFGFKIHFSYEKELLGTGGALKKCSNLLQEPFLLLNADIISNLDLLPLIEANETTLALSENSLERKFSVAYYDEKIRDFSGLAGSGYLDNYQYIGAARVTPDIMEYLPEGKSHLVTSGYIPLVKKSKLCAITHSGWWFDTGTPERKGKAEEFMKKINIESKLAELNMLPKSEVLQKLYLNIMEV